MTAVVALHGPEVSWDDLRPRQDEPTVRCWYSAAATGYSTTMLAQLHLVRQTDETLDPSWWRRRLGPGVTFRLALHPHGTRGARGVRERVELGEFGGATMPSGRPVLQPDEVAIRTPGGVLRALRDPDSVAVESEYVVDRFGWSQALRAAAEAKGWIKSNVVQVLPRRLRGGGA